MNDKIMNMSVMNIAEASRFFAFPNASSSICAKLGESIFQCFLYQAIASHLYRSPWSTASKCSLTC